MQQTGNGAQCRHAELKHVVEYPARDVRRLGSLIVDDSGRFKINCFSFKKKKTGNGEIESEANDRSHQ